MVKSYAYDAYGNTTESGTFTNSFAYTGAVIDEETGLYYMNARYYEPATGRFISADKYRGDGELYWNLYVYCNDDPINCTDITGHYYNRNKAIKYAKYWAYRTNKQYYSSSSDCANFVSQCLYAGGIPMNKKWHSYRTFNKAKFWWDPRSIISYKYWYDWDITSTWRLVKDQYNYFKSSSYAKGRITISSNGASIEFASKVAHKGDPMYLDDDGNGIPNHAVIISKVSYGKMIYYAGHTKSRYDWPLSKYLNNQSKKAYIILFK